MDTIMENLPLTAFLLIAAAVCAVLVSRTKYKLLFTVVQGIAAMFLFLSMIWLGASLEELLLLIALLLLPSFFAGNRDGRESK